MQATCLRRKDLSEIGLFFLNWVLALVLAHMGLSPVGIAESRVRPKGYEPSTSERFTKHSGKTTGA